MPTVAEMSRERITYLWDHVVTDEDKQRVGSLALNTFVWRELHQRNRVAEAQNKVGPGYTEESARNYGLSQSAVDTAIIEILVAAEEEEKALVNKADRPTAPTMASTPPSSGSASSGPVTPSADAAADSARATSSSETDGTEQTSAPAAREP